MSRRLDPPPTLEQWREWADTARRNWTDEPLGHATAAKRSRDAQCSRLFDQRPPARPPRPRSAAA